MPETNDKGASLIQFAVALPLLMAFILVIIDVGRVSSVRGVVNEALSRSIQVASTVPNLDIDPTGRTIDDIGYQRLQLARSKSVDSGHGWLSSVGVIDLRADSQINDDVAAALLDLEFAESRIAGPPEVTTSKIAVLMPGECVTVAANGQVECNRETLGTTAAGPAPVQRPDLLIKRHPVKAVAFLQIDAFTPALFTEPIKLEHFAYRPSIPHGPFPADEDPGILAGERPDNPDDSEPLGNPKLPEEDEMQCVPSHGKCIKDSMSDQSSPSLIPAIWLPPDPADNFCYCLPANERPQ